MPGSGASAQVWCAALWRDLPVGSVARPSPGLALRLIVTANPLRRLHSLCWQRGPHGRAGWATRGREDPHEAECHIQHPAIAAEESLTGGPFRFSRGARCCCCCCCCCASWRAAMTRLRHHCAAACEAPWWACGAAPPGAVLPPSPPGLRLSPDPALSHRHCTLPCSDHGQRFAGDVPRLYFAPAAHPGTHASCTLHCPRPSRHQAHPPAVLQA